MKQKRNDCLQFRELFLSGRVGWIGTAQKCGAVVEPRSLRTESAESHIVSGGSA